MSNERETCLICFQDYLIRNTKEHQCPDEIAEKILSCDDCNSQITVELSAYGNGKMATINCPKCGISYDTDLDPTDINELEKEMN